MEIVAPAMMSVSHLSLRSPSASCVGEPASLLATDAPSNSCASYRCSETRRCPSTSLVALSSRGALSGASKLSFLLRGGRIEAAGMRNAAMGTTSAAVTSTVDLNARRPEVETAIDDAMNNCITESYLNDTIPSLGPKIRGKVSTSPTCFLTLIF